MVKQGGKRGTEDEEVETEEPEDFDKILQEYVAQDPGKSVPVARIGFYFICGAIVTILPVHLYRTPMFDLTFEKHGMYFVGVTLLCTFLIMQAYTKTAASTEAKWLKERSAKAARGRKGGKVIREDELKSETAREAVMYSLFINNFIFMLAFLFTAFGIMPWVDNTFIGTAEDDEEGLQIVSLANYVTSLVAPSFLLVFIN